MKPSERVELVTVESTYQFKPDMLVILPDFPVPWTSEGTGWADRVEKVTVVRPDGREAESTAEIRMTHLNIRDPNVSAEDRWHVIMWLTDLQKTDVPIGSKIFVSPELRDALRANKAA